MKVAIRIARILVPVDGSEYSRHAAQHAVRIGQAYGAEVVFLHVVDDQLVSQLADLEADGRERARERLAAQGAVHLRDVAQLAEQYGLAHREQVAEGDPCAVIADMAVHLGVDLLVMGKIGRRGTRRILVGSVTRRVIESVDLPVLVVSAPPTDVGP